MSKILHEEFLKKKARGGRDTKLAPEDMLLMTLEYLREYRTYFHISQSYGISESNAYKIIRWVEDTLIRNKDFSLPGRKALLKSDHEHEVILIDARACLETTGGEDPLPASLSDSFEQSTSEKFLRNNSIFREKFSSHLAQNSSEIKAGSFKTGSSESPIERPKKNKKGSILVRRKDTPLKVR